jgi:hypothetical protein
MFANKAYRELASLAKHKGNWPSGHAERLASATITLLSSVYGVPAHGLTGAELVKQLRTRGVPAEVLEPTGSIFRLLDEIRFAPGLLEDAGKRVSDEVSVLLAVVDEPAESEPPPPPSPADDPAGSSAHWTPELEEYRKKPGTAYVMIFGTGPQKKKGIAGFLDNTTTVPVIDLGKQCVCCDKRANTYRKLRGDAYGDYYGGHIYKAPVCDECYFHAVASAFASHMACVFAGIGVMLMILGIFLGWGYVVAGAIMAGPPVLFFWVRSLVAKQRVKTGHHSGLEFNITDGYVTIYTYNPRLAKDLLERYGAICEKPDWKRPASRKAI